MVTRADRGLVAEWWWTIDRVLLALLIGLMTIGLVLSLAASPSVAERLKLPGDYFIIHQVVFAVPSLALMIALSFLDPRQVRRAALVLFAIAFLATLATLFVGMEAKGARRWIFIAGMSIQPSEFLKPAFVVLTAFLLSEGSRRPELPGKLAAAVLLAIVIAPLIAQPDFGQSMLIAIVWGGMFFLSGMAWRWIIVLGGTGVGGLAAGYAFLPHVTSRIDRFLHPSSGDTYQVDTALQSIIHGGWFGVGPGEGTVKRILPDAHTDFVFAVTAEEFGIIACGLLVTLFLVIALRGLWHALRETDEFVRLAICGLVLLFGVQATINMAVNLQLIPAKGMTLPFISYGGSSLLSVAIEMGFVLALCRRHVRPVRIAPFERTLGGYSAGGTIEPQEAFG